MPSMMELMLGGGTEQKAMQALAGKLRRKRDISNLAMLSGDPTLQGFGTALHQDAQLQQKLKTGQAESAADRELKQGYFDQLAEQSSFRKTMAQRKQDEVERHNQAMEAAAAIRASKVNAGKIPPSSSQKTTMAVVKKVDGIGHLLDTFKDEYGTKAPGEGTVSNILGKTALSSDAQKKQSEWWSLYELIYTLPERHDLFGSALTAQERAAWKQANISENSPPEVIRAGLKRLQDISNRALSKQYVSDAAIYDPGWVESIYSQVELPFGGGKIEPPTPEKEEEEVDTSSAPVGKSVPWNEMK